MVINDEGLQCFQWKAWEFGETKEKMTSTGGVEVVVGDEIIEESIYNWVSICRKWSHIAPAMIKEEEELMALVILVSGEKKSMETMNYHFYCSR